MSDNNNYVANKLTYTKDALELYLTKYESYKTSQKSWQLWLSIFLTLLVAVVSSSVDWMHFKHPFEFIMVISLAVSCIFLIVSYLSYFFKEDPIKQLRDTLYNDYINKPDQNALFVIKRIKNGEDQILVYKKKAWGSVYFLPYIRVKAGDRKVDIRKKIANILNYKPTDIDITMFFEQHEITEKYHPTEKVVKEYHSSYYHLSASQTLVGRDISAEDKFHVEAKEFEWKTQIDLENDQRTQDKNKDVLSMLREHKFDFITNSAPFSS